MLVDIPSTYQKYFLVLFIFSLSCSSSKDNFSCQIIGGPSQSIGPVYSSNPFEWFLTLKNTGSSPILLSKQIKTSCQCTKAFVLDDRVMPGKVTHIKLLIHPSQSVRDQLITLSIPFLEPQTIPPISCKLTFKFVKRWTITPKAFSLTGAPGTVSEDACIVKSHSSEHRLRVTSITGLPDFITTKLQSRHLASDDSEELSISFICKFPAEPISQRYSVFIHTNDEKKPKEKIDLVVESKSIIYSNPPSIFVSFRDIQQGDKEVTRLDLTTQDGYLIENISVNETSNISLDTQKVKDNNFLVDVAVDPQNLSKGIHRYHLSAIARSGNKKPLTLDVPIIVVIPPEN
ncbi:DUF1573 domain-containing protein [Gimesia aquarii]|uniref:DUF1573 domain-containing protein n=1 Tax=Gimesia aquarii TaxID=2527964 RepID=A0A517VXM5_9PLAN|nr:DUF1573 domain-containing protein [Gimesia aquarii]QDT97760.1 hypothetical protein V144x_32420 [Gimesia aquarii]